MRRTFEVEFAVDNVKAFKIAERLLDQFYNRKGIFKDYSMPEYVLPRNLKEGTREHALFLTYCNNCHDYILWRDVRLLQNKTCREAEGLG